MTNALHQAALAVWYQVESPEGAVLFKAPLSMVAVILDLQKPAVQRIIREANEGVVTMLHFNGRAPKGMPASVSVQQA